MLLDHTSLRMGWCTYYYGKPSLVHSRNCACIQGDNSSRDYQSNQLYMCIVRYYSLHLIHMGSDCIGHIQLEVVLKYW